MRHIRLFLMTGLLIACLLFNGTAQGAGNKQADNGTADQKAAACSPSPKTTDQGKTVARADTKTNDLPVYKPPLRGSPTGRVGGGTRGISERESFSLQVLAPDHIGTTIKEQPCLYWFISKPIPHQVELTIMERGAVKPVLEKVVKGPERGGIQAFRLADYGVKLNKNASYKWFVAIVTDPEHRSRDILAGGIISMVDSPSGLQGRLQEAGKDKASFVYAGEGLWYDALESVSEMIDASPDNKDLRRQRASLLQQVGLTEAAESENVL